MKRFLARIDHDGLSLVETPNGHWVKYLEANALESENVHLVRGIQKLELALAMIAGGYYPGHDVALFAAQALASAGRDATLADHDETR
jgi:hypothetical protein